MAVSSAALDPRPRPWHERARRGFVRFWRSEDPRVSAVRDVAVAAGFVLLLLGVIWVYTGQSFPSQAPLVVVESGSMMHGPDGPCLGGSRGCADFERPFFGRMGTIDPGDLVLVKEVTSLEDVETAFGGGSRDGYGAHGDVLVYRRPQPGAETPVIHRALLTILVKEEGCLPGGANESGCTYVIPETCKEGFAAFVQPKSGSSDWSAYCEGSTEPITLDLRRDGVFLSLDNYPCGPGCNHPFRSGIITKGDNNQFPDQPRTYQGEGATAAIACCPIRAEWIVGKARGEVPWFGLIKLALYGNERYQCGENEACSDPTRERQWTFGRATAPWDIWLMLFVAIGFLIAAPIGIDYLMAAWRRGRKSPPAQEETKPRSEAPAAAAKPTPVRRPAPARRPAPRRRSPPQR